MKVYDPVQVYRTLYPSYQPKNFDATERSSSDACLIPLSEKINKAQAYIDKIAGSCTIRDRGNCHNILYYVACILIHGFAIDPFNAMPLLEAWNRKCVPIWTTKELQHKLEQAEKHGDGYGRKPGHLLFKPPIDTSMVEGFIKRVNEELDRKNGTANQSDTTSSSHGVQQSNGDDAYVPFPTHLLPEPLCQFVYQTATAIGCDHSYVALPLLSVIAAAIGDACKLEAKKDWVVPAIIWTAFIGESGTAKSPALRAVMKYLKQYQQRHRHEYERQMRQYEQEFDLYEVELKRWKNKGLIKANIPKPELPVEPLCRRTIVSDSTMESLITILADNPGGVLAFFDELAGFFGGHDKYRKGTDSDSAAWLSIFNGESISVDRKGTGYTFVPSAFVSITGGIQPALLPLCFTSRHQNSGLMARFLMASPPRNAKHWTEDEVSEEIDTQMSSIFQYCWELQPITDDVGNRTPSLFQFDRESKSIWTQYYNDHNQEQLDTSGSLAAAFSKLEEYPLRFAIVFHCVKQFMGATADNRIQQETITFAIELTNWFKNEAKRIYGLMSENERETTSSNLMQWIKAKNGSTTVRDLQRSLKRQYPKASLAEAALNQLVENKLGNWESVSSKNGGRPTKIFRLTTDDAPTQ